MKLIFLLILNLQLFSQSENILLKQENIRLFADFLYSENDFLRAISEYEKLNDFNSNDTILYKTANSLIEIHNYDKADLLLNKILPSSKLNFYSRELKNKISFLEGNYESLETKESLSQIRLLNLSYIYHNKLLSNKELFISFYEKENQYEIENFYERKINPDYKSITKAAFLSAILPGLGKVYTGEIGDGIAAFASTILSGYLSYANFKAGHKFRSWLFSGITLLYYAGNIYGAAASADIYNKRIDFQFKVELDSFIRNNNYFIQVPELK